MDTTQVYNTVNTGYSSIATEAHAEKQDETSNSRIATSFGYSAEELSSLPSGTNLGLSCGNPLATGNLKPTETMLDLGSGGGLDCLIAANQMLKASATPTGKIYGVDRSESMIALARRNFTKANIPSGLVEYIHAQISDIPLPNSTIDLVVSNCVINLVPDADKPQVFKEIHRLLKPGGRLAISDLLAKKPMPEHIRHDAALLVGCVAGASQVQEYQRWMEEAGFSPKSIVFVNTEKDLNVYHEARGGAVCCTVETEVDAPSCCQPSKKDCSKSGGQENGTSTVQANGKSDEQLDFNEWVASYQIYAIK